MLYNNINGGEWREQMIKNKEIEEEEKKQIFIKELKEELKKEVKKELKKELKEELKEEIEKNKKR